MGEARPDEREIDIRGAECTAVTDFGAQQYHDDDSGLPTAASGSNISPERPVIWWMSVNASRPPGQEDLVPAGNFDSPLRINGVTGRVQWPSGPLFPGVGETMLRVEVWVMQKMTGAMQITYQDNFPGPGIPQAWLANQWPPPPYNWGVFQPGPALGTAVAIATKGNVQSYYWWSQEVELSYKGS